MEEAIICYEKLVELNPNDFGSFLNLGNALSKASRELESIECYLKALELNSRVDEIYVSLAMVLMNIGQIE